MLMTVWSGQLEHDRTAPGLSRLTGPSSLCLVMAEGDTVGGSETREGDPSRRPLTHQPAKMADIRRRLHAGQPYTVIARALGCSVQTIYRIRKGRWHG